MAFDFPSSPTVNQVYTPILGLSYKWNGVTWDVTSLVNPDAPADGKTYGRKDAGWSRAVDVAGDTMTGDLAIAYATPRLTFNKTDPTKANNIFGQTNGALRWQLALGNNAAEGGSNTGSDFAIFRANDAGATVDAPLSIARANGLTTLAGDLNIVKAAGSRAVLNVENSDAAQRSQINLRRSGKDLFQIRTSGDAAANPYLYVVDDSLVERAVFGFVRPNARVVLESGQMTWPATANPSTDANTLDDYREGSWVPTLMFNGASVGVTYTQRNGRYLRIGNTVIWWCYLNISSKGTSTGQVAIGGLPFAATVAGTSGHPGTVSYNSGLISITIPPVTMVQGGFAAAPLWTSLGGGSITDANFSTASQLYMGGTYEV
jgi:hypothetical protein